MASEELRKKWGTIFMGEREATVDQLNAMQEPLRREKEKQDQEADYLARVRGRATEKAKQILGEAYAERLKVLEEARAEIAADKRRAASEVAAMRAEAESLRAEAQEELARAQAEREKAVSVREAAHGEGYQVGLTKAEAELAEFRAELGQSVAGLLKAIAAQRTSLASEWREELAELTQSAVAAGCAHVLSQESAAILRTLLFQALNMLESRAMISVRVNPEDESAISDMFQAARERIPDLGQWVISADPQIERGGLVAESGSGRVDARREHFREMVDGIISHLSLPERPSEQAGEREVQNLLAAEIARLARLAPDPASEEAKADANHAPAPEDSETPEAGADTLPEPHLEAEQNPEPDAAEAADFQEEQGQEETPLEDQESYAPSEAEYSAQEEAQAEACAYPEALTPEESLDAEATDFNEALPDKQDLPDPEDFPAAEMPASEAGEEKAEDDSACDPALGWLPPLGNAANANPSLAELEEELFPLEDEEARSAKAKKPASQADEPLPPDVLLSADY